MLVRQNSFVFLEKVRKQRSFSFRREKFYLPFIEAPTCCSAQPKKEGPVISVFEEGGSAIDRSVRTNLVLTTSPL